jgi:hypothetical protein
MTTPPARAFLTGTTSVLFAGSFALANNPLGFAGLVSAALLWWLWDR